MEARMSKRVMPVKVEKIDLTGDYEGWFCHVRTNPPMKVFEAFQDSGNMVGMREAVGSILREPWNFVDEQGEPFTGPPDEEGKPTAVDPIEAARELPLELVAQILSQAVAKISTLPNANSAE